MKTFDDIEEATPPKGGWNEGETTPPPLDDGMVIDRSKIVSATTMTIMIMEEAEVDERLLFTEHPTRPMLMWMVLPKSDEPNNQ